MLMLSITDQGQPMLYIVLISTAGSLLIVAAVVIFCIYKKYRKTDHEGKCYLLLLNQSVARTIKETGTKPTGNRDKINQK